MIECSWSNDARVTDLSAEGCYVDCRHVPRVGTHAAFDLILGDASTTLCGTVVHARHGLGFAMQFVSLDASAARQLRRYLFLHAANRWRDARAEHLR